MSKVNEIKNKIKSSNRNASELMYKDIKEENLYEEIKKRGKEEKKIERKRVSFDLRIDLHRQLKMESLLREKNIYLLIEEALEDYLAK